MHNFRASVFYTVAQIPWRSAFATERVAFADSRFARWRFKRDSLMVETREEADGVERLKYASPSNLQLFALPIRAYRHFSGYSGKPCVRDCTKKRDSPSVHRIQTFSRQFKATGSRIVRRIAAFHSRAMLYVCIYMWSVHGRAVAGIERSLLRAEDLLILARRQQSRRANECAAVKAASPHDFS